MTPSARPSSPLRRWHQRLARGELFFGRRDEALLELGQRRIYVLPSRAGLSYAFTLLLMLMAAINYNLNVGYGLIFVLAGAGFISTLHAYRNLLGLRLQPARSEAVFAGGHAELAVRIDNPQPRRRPALQLRIAQGERRFSLPSQSSTTVSVVLPAPQRGRLVAGRTLLETHWPLGLIRAWTVWYPPLSCLVYPQPEDDPPPLPAGAVGNGNSRQQQAFSGSDDFAGLSAFQPSDSPRHIAWQVLARGGPLVVKRFSSQQGDEIELDWQTLPAALDTEQRLSRLCAWLLAAEASGRNYALRLPAQQFPPGRGSLHLQHCLSALALFADDDGGGSP